MKAICLLSGGLDSTLAAKIMLDLGIEVEALNFVTVFCTCTPKSFGCSAASAAAHKLGIPVSTINNTKGMLEILKDPPHGYGRYLNPCIDCRIQMFDRARQYMEEIGASFLVTGEVLGERPMSQRLDAMRLIEREAGLHGLIVRPLCAKVLPPSIPEREGWVERSKLLAITGRSRKPQIELARSYGIHDYPCPAGGCRLTDAGFAGRMRDLLDHNETLTTRDVSLLRWGRHFRISPRLKCIVGRNEKDNAALSRLTTDGHTLVEPVGTPGPTVLVVGTCDESCIELACRLAAAYSDGGRDGEEVAFDVQNNGLNGFYRAFALEAEERDALQIKPLSKGWRSEQVAGKVNASERIV